MPQPESLARVLCFTFVVGAGAAGLCAPTAGAEACRGDCNGDGMVTVDELVTGVNIALDIQPLATCAAMDVNGDGQVTVGDGRGVAARCRRRALALSGVDANRAADGGRFV